MITFVRKLYAWYHRPKSKTADFFESLLWILPVVFLVKTFVFGLYQVPTCSMETTLLVGERFVADKLTPWFMAPQRGDIISFNDPNFAYSQNKWVRVYQNYADWHIQNWTKRVIGIPGDHVQGKIEDGKPVVYLNGVKLDEPYLNKYPIAFVFKEDLVSGGDRNTGYCHRTYDDSLPFEDQPFYRLSAMELVRGKMVIGEQAIVYPGSIAYDQHGRNVDEYDVQLGANEYWVMGDNRLASGDSRFWGKLDGSLIHGKIVFRLWSIDTNQSWWIFDLLMHPIDFFKRIRWSRCLQFIK